MSDSLWPHGLQHARHPCPSLSPGPCWNSCPSNQWCHPTISSSVALFSSCCQSFPASGSFPVSWLFVSGGQSICLTSLSRDTSEIIKCLAWKRKKKKDETFCKIVFFRHVCQGFFCFILKEWVAFSSERQELVMEFFSWTLQLAM